MFIPCVYLRFYCRGNEFSPQKTTIDFNDDVRSTNRLLEPVTRKGPITLRIAHERVVVSSTHAHAHTYTVSA